MAFTWFDKFTEALMKLGEDDRKEVVWALAQYGMTGEMPAIPYPLDVIAESFREDIDNSVTARANGSKGGRPSAKPGVSGNGKPGVSDEAEPGVSENRKNDETPAYIDQTRPDQTSTGKEHSGESAPRFSEELFERAWRAYPRKCGKKAAREAYRRSVRNGADPDAIQAGVERFAASSRGQPERFIPHGSTFFSQERWADEPMDKAAAPIVGAPAAGEGGWMPDAG